MKNIADMGMGIDQGGKMSVEFPGGSGDRALDRVDERKTEGDQAALPKAASPDKSSQGTPGSPKPDCRALAQILSLQPVPKSHEGQWGLLTAVSEKARNRSQGWQIILCNSEHLLGRVVAEVSCQFDSPAVSGRHCTLTRRLISFDGQIKDPGSDRAGGDVYAVFVRDSSSNGTFINKEKLKKNGAEVRLRHGDIVSLVALPEHTNAFAFVFREVLDESNCKRKGSPSEQELELSAGEGKRIRAGNVAVMDCPVSLDDVRRLQRSNEDLRQQLEAHVLDTEKMRGEFRAAESLHVVELKELRASVTEMHVHQIEEIRLELVSKTKDLEESAALCVQQQTTIEDLNHRLASAAQSQVDAEEAIRSHTSTIAELKKRLEDEFSQRQKERVEWESNLDSAVERTRMEAAEELKRHSDASLRIQKEQQDIILDLQEADKENRRLADSLRKKLEAERQAVMTAEEKGRRVGLQLQEERIGTENAWKRAAEFELELRKVSEELESEKAGRESARAKVSSLELAMETAIRELSLEKQRLQGARERIVLRETQLRAFYSTAAKVEALQQKQQQQLKVMLSALEDGDGDGDYCQSRKSKILGQSGLGDQARMGSSSLKIISSARDADQQTMKEKGLVGHTGSANGTNEKKMPMKEGEDHDRKGSRTDPDWIDGDTQQEDEDGPVVSNFPSTSNGRIEGSESMLGVQNIVKEDDDARARALISNPADTQLLELGPAVATQLIPENDSGEDRPILKDRAAFTSMVFDVRRASRVDSSIPVNDNGDNDGVAQDTDDGVAGDATMLVYDSLQQMESEGARMAVENEDVPAVNTPNLNVRNRLTSSDREVKLGGKNREGTICTQDLLTSEVLSSWAFGTQDASVHAENELGSVQCVDGWVNSAAQADTQFEGKEYEGTMCTDDLLASEVAGSWAAGTPASVHADNESLGSDERNESLVAQEGDSDIVAPHQRGMRPRPNAHQILVEEAMQFADPVNSQNSLSPATTNPLRNDRAALSAMLDIVEPGFANLHGLSSAIRRHSEMDDSTTDEDGDENGNDVSDASQPMSTSPSVFVR